MVQRPTIVVSDAHLGAVPEASERAFLEFLHAVPEATDDLVIVGDLFDFWFEYGTVVLRRHFTVLRRLAELVEAGVRIRLLAGNHDAWGGSFLRDSVGLELLEGETVILLGGRRAFVAHGDGLAGGDWGYRLLKRLTRSRPGTAAFRLLHPDIAVPLVRRMSGTAEKAPGTISARADRLSEHADRLLRADPDLDLVVFGHAHRPELREVEPGRHYLNPGDWIHHSTYGLVSPDGVDLRRWGGSRGLSPSNRG